jgi:hypothetical protein
MQKASLSSLGKFIPNWTGSWSRKKLPMVASVKADKDKNWMCMVFLASPVGIKIVQQAGCGLEANMLSLMMNTGKGNFSSTEICRVENFAYYFS